MKKTFACKHIGLLLVLVLLVTSICGCDTSSENTDSYAKKIIDGYIKKPSTIPVSFTYEGKEYKGLDSDFTLISNESNELDTKTEYEVKYQFKDTGAVFTFNFVGYKDYEAYEYTMWIENTSIDNDTGVFSDILALNTQIKGKNQVLKGINGDTGDMYAPYEVELSDNMVEKTSTSGRPTHGNFPYFKLDYNDESLFIAIGWPGCWKTSFVNTNDVTTIKAGQYEIETYLKPGEKIRTPLVVFVRSDNKDDNYAMNLWRSWFIYENMHRDASGNVIQPVFAASTMSQGTTTAQLKRIINAYYEKGIEIDYLWMDAGWYVNAKGETCSWTETGTLTINEKMFPDKLSEVSSLIHEKGGKTLLWFEPEVVRCDKEDFLTAYPDFKEEWFLGTAAGGTWLEGQLVDLGNEEAREWLLTKIFKVIDEGGIDMYRQDFNVDPGPVWTLNDDTNRVGITENKYVVGYLAFWDAILERYPNMAALDSCASGGGRNDIESLRRAVMLHVSDFWDGNTGGVDERQAVQLSLASWIPYFKLEKNSGLTEDTYTYRSCYAPWTIMNVSTMSKKTDWDLLKKMYDEWQQLSRLYYSDYYALTDFSKSSDAWRAWEYNDSSSGKACVQFFRGSASETSSMTFKLFGLDKDSTYEIVDGDGLFNTSMTGKDLMENGITLNLNDKGSSGILFITKK